MKVRFRFGLRLLLLMTTAIAILAGWGAYERRLAAREQAVKHHLQLNGKRSLREYRRSHEYRRWPISNSMVVVESYCDLPLEPQSQLQRSGIVRWIGGDNVGSRIVEIDLSANGISASEQYRALSELKNIRILVLSELSTDEDLSCLRELRQLQSVSAIDARSLNGSFIRFLEQSHSLCSLDLTLSGVDGAHLKHLAHFHNLRVLRLGATRVRPSDFKFLVTLHRLCVLDLPKDAPISSEFSMPLLPDLKILSASATDKGMLSISQLPSLEQLDLSKSRELTGNGLRLVGSLAVKHLDLAGCNLSDDDLAFLEYCDSLATLNLSQNPITDASVNHIRSCISLKSLDIRDTFISDKAARRFSGIEIIK